MKKVGFYICSSLFIMGLAACESSSSQIEEEDENPVALWVHSDRTETFDAEDVTFFEHTADTVVFDINVKKLKVDSISIDGEVIDYGVTLQSGETLDCGWIHLLMSDYKLYVATDSFRCNSRDDIFFNVNVSGPIDSKSIACYKAIKLIGYVEPGLISFAVDTMYFSNRNVAGTNCVLIDDSYRAGVMAQGYYNYQYWGVTSIEIDGKEYGRAEGFTYNSIYGEGKKVDWLQVKRDGEHLYFQVDKNRTGKDRSFKFNASIGAGNEYYCSFVGIQAAD